MIDYWNWNWIYRLKEKRDWMKKNGILRNIRIVKQQKNSPCEFAVRKYIHTPTLA